MNEQRRPGSWTVPVHRIKKLPLRWQQEVLLWKGFDGPLDEWVLKPIKYDFRPRSYWDPLDLRQLVANIKGAERKKRALALLKQGRLEEANDFILADTLSEEDREMAGRIHPAFMGGEYLPDYRPGEVEIARVTVASMLEDVTSVRARPHGARIGYPMPFAGPFVCRL